MFQEKDLGKNKMIHEKVGQKGEQWGRKGTEGKNSGARGGTRKEEQGKETRMEGPQKPSNMKIN